MDVFLMLVACSPLISHQRAPVRRSHVIAGFIGTVVVVLSSEVHDHVKITVRG